MADPARGRWRAPCYYAFAKSTFLNQSLVVVAFYTGNDSIESFSMTYTVDAYSEFRPDPNLSSLYPEDDDGHPLADGYRTIA